MRRQGPRTTETLVLQSRLEGKDHNPPRRNTSGTAKMGRQESGTTETPVVQRGCKGNNLETQKHLFCKVDGNTLTRSRCDTGFTEQMGTQRSETA